MTRVPVRKLLGLGDVPKHRASAVDWLKRNCVPIHKQQCNGGMRDEVVLSDLPEDVLTAYRLRLAEDAGLDLGPQDDEAHIALQSKPRGTQAIADYRAAVLMFVHRHCAAGFTWAQTVAQFEAAGHGKAPSYKTVQRWFKRVLNVNPANWAPALAPDYLGNTSRAEIHPEAREDFYARIAAFGRNGTGVNFHKAWKKTKKKADENGWPFPCYETALREFKRQPVEWQRVQMKGAQAAAVSLTMRQPRSLEGLTAMEQVELDGREFKVKVRFKDGKVGCPWVIVYADRAFSKIVGWSISDSENEEAVAQATINMCDSHGIPDRCVTDNGGAINCKRMMGGLTPLIRRKETKKADWDVPGVFKIYSIELRNCAPRKGWAKLVERIYSVLNHVDNDPVFYRAQRSGPNDAPNPNPVPVDFELFEATINDEIGAFNEDRDTRAMGVRKGENRNEAFIRLSADRIHRPVTSLQRREVQVKYKG